MVKCASSFYIRLLNSKLGIVLLLRQFICVSFWLSGDDKTKHITFLSLRSLFRELLSMRSFVIARCILTKC